MTNENMDADGVKTGQSEGSPACFEVSGENAQMRVVLDTDIGGDLDDANALALLLASREVELVGVTTVSMGASARRRAAVARHMLMVAGRGDVPVFAGSYSPLPDPVLAMGMVMPEHLLNAWEPSMGEAETPPAAQALVDLAAEYGPELTILAIGAMTNLAEAVRISPTTMSRVGRVVSMGGAFRSQEREANVLFDPHSADTVYRAGLPLLAVGFEVADRVKIPLWEYELVGNRSRVLGELARQARSFEAAFHPVESVTLYDVTAAAAVLAPSWFPVEHRRVAVELQSAMTLGLTVAQLGGLNALPSGTVLEIATDVDAEAVERLFRERVLTGGNLP